LYEFVPEAKKQMALSTAFVRSPIIQPFNPGHAAARLRFSVPFTSKKPKKSCLDHTNR
jgi:hypothetical protein